MGNDRETEPDSSGFQGLGTGAMPLGRSPVLTARALHEGADGLRAYREASGKTCSIAPLGDPRGFRAHSRIHHLGTAVLSDVRSSSLRYIRSARHIAYAAYDHYQIIFHVAGDAHYSSGRHSAAVHPEDIVILDSAREAEARIHAPDQGSAHALTLYVPRAALAPLQRTPDGGHLLVLSREQAAARVLRDRLSKMVRMVELEAHTDLHAAAQDVIGRLAGAFKSAGDLAQATHSATQRPQVDSLKRFIERRLYSPALSVELLCLHCGCSRASLYRLLEAEGGPIRYIRQRRLQRAFRELICGRVPHGQILALAQRHHFASGAAFNRAFHRTFGLPPGEARDLAARSSRAALAAVTSDRSARSDGAQAIDWIRTLSQGVSAVS